MMSIDRNNDTPLYQQLQLLLQDKILLGEWSPGVLMPTEQELCETYGISRITVRRALENLERSNLIERVQGRGSIVKNRELQKSATEVRGYSKAMQAQGFTPRSELLDKKIIIGNSSLVELFKLPQGGDHYFWHFCRLRYISGEPAVIMNHYVRKELGDRMVQYDLGNVSYYSLYEKILQQQLFDSEGLITAVLSSPKNAKLLNIKVGDPLIWYRGITYLVGGITVEVNYSLFIGEKFQFETHIFKPRELKLGMLEAMEGIGLQY